MRKIVSVLFLLCSPSALASTTPITTYINEARTIGEARFQFMFIDIYDAKLYAPKNGWSFSRPFALQLKYLRNLQGNKIADRSAKEIRSQGFKNELKLADWHAQMTNIFPNVTNGTILTGIYKPNDETIFYLDNEMIGRVEDPEFGKWFFGIWLSNNTSEPDFREALLGQNK